MSEAKEAHLRTLLAGYARAYVAFSAGVDSTYLLDVAREVLGERAEAVTADSPSLTRASLGEAQAFCASRGIVHHVVATDEFERAEYRANDVQRCFHCKSALFRAMNGLAAATAATRGPAALLLGAIADDFNDVRPGLQAAIAAGAAFPLASAGFTKAEVRARSQARSLPTWNRPAEPCLASRVPYGEPVTPEIVRLIEAAEVELHRLGLRECRARLHQVGGGRGRLLRIEVPDGELAVVLAARAELLPRLRGLGIQHIALDLAGLVSGGFNQLLSPAERAAATVAAQ